MLSSPKIKSYFLTVPKDIWAAWDEVRLCANLLREGKARVVVATRKDGSTYRYTKQGKNT